MKIIILSLVVLYCFQVKAQRCGCIGGGTDMNTGDINALGYIELNDTSSLAFFKPLNNIDSIRREGYFVTLNIDNKYDNIVVLNRIGQFEINLKDNSKIIWNDVRFFNGSIGNQGNEKKIIMFSCTITEEQMRNISENPVVNLTAFGKFSYNLNEKTQKRQLKIVNCLIKEKVINK